MSGTEVCQQRHSTQGSPILGTQWLYFQLWNPWALYCDHTGRNSSVVLQVLLWPLFSWENHILCLAQTLSSTYFKRDIESWGQLRLYLASENTSVSWLNMCNWPSQGNGGNLFRFANVRVFLGLPVECLLEAELPLRCIQLWLG